MPRFSFYVNLGVQHLNISLAFLYICDILKMFQEEQKIKSEGYTIKPERKLL